MAKRRRRRRRKANPRRRSRARRRRRNPGALLVNPRRRRGRRRRRRNPAILKAGLRGVLDVAIPATIGGAIIGFVDSKFLGTAGTVVRLLGKVGVAIGLGTFGQKFLGKENARIAMGAVVSTIGHELGVRLGGGMVAMTKAEGVSALIEAAAEDEEIAALLEEGPTGVSPGPAYGADYMAVGGGGTYLSDYATGLPPGGGQHPYPALAEMAVGADGTVYQDDETGAYDEYGIEADEYGGAY